MSSFDGYKARKKAVERISAREQALRMLGLVEFTPLICQSRKDDLVKQIRIGLERTTRGETPTMLDGGLFAIKTILPPSIPQETWREVPQGTKGLA
ncbi:MAG TPA: hypothetical protein VLF20_03245, partial [Patescibacteria group bacterium]|nr:hypothetical protein [Patescibacteria group bacterium]